MMIGVLVLYGLESRLSKLGDGGSLPSEPMRGHAMARRKVLPALTLLLTAVALAAAFHTAPPDRMPTGEPPGDVRVTDLAPSPR
jgi:hypothetical protein